MSRLTAILSDPKTRKRLLLIFTLGAIAGVFVIPLNPVNSKIFKLAFLGSLGVAWFGLLLLLWHRKPHRITVLVVPLLLALPFLLPGREMDADELRQDYVRRMSALEGAEYYWGGESSRGIDCSGLPRRALRDALLAYGIRHFNGRATRAYLEQWWFDASAVALAKGHRDYTNPVGVGGTIQEMSYDPLVPGDLAVTENGIHVLAYVGAGKWIQADPGVGAVVTLDGRSADNGWFRTPVRVYRWRVLE
ncbi:MAG: NlpC/P60 family protein [Akkermansiaceae bacterium]|nr:NlpC/P60 family protein [Akkermansiaceae bacterium]